MLIHNQAAFSQVIQKKDSIRETISQIKTNKTIKSIPNNQNTSQNQSETNSQEEAMMEWLAKELNTIGITMSEKELDRMIQALMKGGQSAMAVAHFITSAITEQKTEAPKNGSSPTIKHYSISEQQLENMLQVLSKSENAKLEIVLLLKPKLKQAKLKM
ncbi:MAG: hypothetical protein WBC06_08105 [Chitinophagaceae bacterium]